MWGCSDRRSEPKTEPLKMHHDQDIRSEQQIWRGVSKTVMDWRKQRCMYNGTKCTVLPASLSFRKELLEEISVVGTPTKIVPKLVPRHVQSTEEDSLQKSVYS